MAKRVTLTTRWRKWAEGSEGIPADPLWAYTAVGTAAISFASLICHFLFFMPGWFTGGTLIVMCIFAAITEAIFIYRKQGWWAWYWGLCVIIGVSIFEALSYFIGGLL
jgi:hypothetical protein